MKNLILILLFGIVLNVAKGQDFKIEHELIPIGKDSIETTQYLVFKHEFQAIWMQNRFKRAKHYRPYKLNCLKFKCEYIIQLEPGDEFIMLPKRNKPVIPHKVQLKT